MTLIEVSDKELYNLVLPYINKLSNEEIIELFGIHYNKDNVVLELNKIRKYKTKRNFTLTINAELHKEATNLCKIIDKTLSELISILLLNLLKDAQTIIHDNIEHSFSLNESINETKLSLEEVEKILLSKEWYYSAHHLEWGMK